MREEPRTKLKDSMIKSLGSPRIKKKGEEFTSPRRQTFYKQHTPQLLGTCVGSVVGSVCFGRVLFSPFCIALKRVEGPNL